MIKTWQSHRCVWMLGMLMAGCGTGNVASPTTSPSPTPIISPSPMPSPGPTPTLSPTPSPTMYTISATVQLTPINCTEDALGKDFTCNATSSSLGINISYNSTPISYLVIPPQASVPSGLTIATSGVCSTSPVSQYACVITIGANNVGSGYTLSIPVNGELGMQSYYTVKFQ